MSTDNDCGHEPGPVGRSMGPLFDADKSGPLTEQELARIRLATMPYLLEVGVRSDMALLITRLIETIDLERARRDADKPMTRRLREALYRAAPSHQGGHSDTGAAIAACLGVAYPINVNDVERAAMNEGFITRDLWPWLYRLREQEHRG